MLGLLGWLGFNFNVHRSVFLVAFSLLLGLAACWLGVTTMLRAQRSGMIRPASSLLGTVFGGIAAVFGVLVLIIFIAFWQQLNAFAHCSGTANTMKAQQTCQAQLEQTTGINSSFGSGQ